MAIIAGKYSPVLRERAEDFFYSLYRGVTFLEPGLIRHRYHPAVILKYPELGLLQRVSALLKRVSMRHRYQDLNALSAGYQAFLLYGLALAEKTSPGIFFTKGSTNFELIQEAIHYVLDEFPGHQSHNRYAWPYNPVGVEMAYVLEVFGNLLGVVEYDELARRWLNLQIAAHYNFDSHFMERNSSDPLTLAARLYEATRLNNYSIDLPVGSGSKR